MSEHAAHVVVSLHGLPLLHVHRTGDLRTVREVLVDIAAEFANLEGAADDARLRAAVQALAPAVVMQEPEQLASLIAHHLVQRLAGAGRVRVDVALQRWSRLEIGGRPRTGDFARQEPDQRTAHVTIDEGGMSVHAGVRGMQLLSAESPAGTPVLVQLDARWTYGWADVPFDTQWQQVRRAIVEAYAERRLAPGAALAHALCCAVLDESPPVRSIDVRLAIRTFEPVDLTRFGMEPLPELVSEPAAGTAVYAATVEREEMQELT